MNKDRIEKRLPAITATQDVRAKIQNIKGKYDPYLQAMKRYDERPEE